MNNTSQSEPVASPCVSVCELDKTDICLGCGRSLEEIGNWMNAGEEERARIVARARQRRQTRAQRA